MVSGGLLSEEKASGCCMRTGDSISSELGPYDTLVLVDFPSKVLIAFSWVGSLVSQMCLAGISADCTCCITFPALILLGKSKLGTKSISKSRNFF